jgi:hypothetical protein
VRCEGDGRALCAGGLEQRVEALAAAARMQAGAPASSAGDLAGSQMQLDAPSLEQVGA